MSHVTDQFQFGKNPISCDGIVRKSSHAMEQSELDMFQGEGGRKSDTGPRAANAILE